ncbi:MAG: type II secretion system protein [Leptolyngbya sp. SIO1D8]|nr:type II secretion system protein [Leptolyngbya sp. SIO1D8]
MQFKMKRSAVERLLKQWFQSNNPEAGLTLIESLIAIIVIGLTVSAITPAFVLAVATRVQSQRTEQANQIAQDEIDKARIVMELGTVDDPGTPDVETRESFLPVDAGDEDVDAVEAPGTFLSLTNAGCLRDDLDDLPGVEEACSIDINGDGEADFAVQTYRVNSYTAPDGEIAAFEMGVRVYAYEATKDPDATGDGDVDGIDVNTERASAGLTSGPRNNERGSYRFAPLAVVYATLVRSEEENSLCDYYQTVGLKEGLTPAQVEADLAAKGVTCDVAPAP